MIRIVEATPLAGYQLRVRFSDGLEGIYQVDPARRGGVFEGLLSSNVFDAVTIDKDFGCVEWPGGVDLCATAMHREMLARQKLTSANA